MFDSNQDGSISPDELCGVFKDNSMFNLEQAQKMINELDTNNDGKIQFNEFERFMKNGDTFLGKDLGAEIF